MTAVVPADHVAVAEFRHATLPLVALVLGIAAITLGVTVVWNFAAVPVGLAAAIVGIMGLRRAHHYDDPRARGRATIGAVLGLVAIVLGVSAAYFLPRVVDRVDAFFTDMQDDVNEAVLEVGERGAVAALERVEVGTVLLLEPPQVAGERPVEAVDVGPEPVVDRGDVAVRGRRPHHGFGPGRPGPARGQPA